MAYGRGGAGNYYAAQEESKRVAEVGLYRLRNSRVAKVNVAFRISRRTALPRLQHRPPTRLPKHSLLIHRKAMHTRAVAVRATGTSQLNCAKMALLLNLAMPLLCRHLLFHKSARRGIPRVRNCPLRGAEEAEQATLFGRVKSRGRKKKRLKRQPRSLCVRRQREVLKQDWRSHLVHCLGKQQRKAGSGHKHCESLTHAFWHSGIAYSDLNPRECNLFDDILFS